MYSRVGMYDRAFAWTSLWMLDAAPPDAPVRYVIYLTAAVSWSHWSYYREGWLKRLDIALSSSLFVYHVHLAWTLQHTRALLMGLASTLVFAANTCALKCRARERLRPNVYNLLPHGLFRLYAYWMVRLVHEGTVDSMVERTLLYWATLLLVYHS